MVEQILLVSTIGNVQGAVWGICILVLGSKGLRDEVTWDQYKETSECPPGWNKKLNETIKFQLENSPFKIDCLKG